MSFNFNFSGVSKYRNKRVAVDEITFDSKKESRIYLDLKAQKETGEIKDFKMQVPFELIPNQKEIVTAFDKKGRPIQKERVVELAIKYLADFVVYHNDGEVTVVDAKGFQGNQVWILKRKLLLFRHGLKIKVV